MPCREGDPVSAPFAAGGAAAGGAATTGARLEELLRLHRGSVTDLLERLAEEPVDADIRSQTCEAAAPGNPLGLAPGTDVVGRAVVLCGRRSGCGFVYAESYIAPDRLPEPVVHRLQQTCDPIGRVLYDNGLRISREPLPGRATASRATEPIASALPSAVLSRRYRILVGTAPAFAVDEWFLGSLAEAVDLRGERWSHDGPP